MCKSVQQKLGHTRKELSNIGKIFCCISPCTSETYCVLGKEVPPLNQRQTVEVFHLLLTVELDFFQSLNIVNKREIMQRIKTSNLILKTFIFGLFKPRFFKAKLF